MIDRFDFEHFNDNWFFELENVYECLSDEQLDYELDMLAEYNKELELLGVKMINLYSILNQSVKIDTIVEKEYILINIGGYFIVRIKDVSQLSDSTIKKLNELGYSLEYNEFNNKALRNRNELIVSKFNDTIKKSDTNKIIDTNWLVDNGTDILKVYKMENNYKYINNKFFKIFDKLDNYVIKSTDNEFTPLNIYNKDIDIIVLPMITIHMRFELKDIKKEIKDVKIEHGNIPF